MIDHVNNADNLYFERFTIENVKLSMKHVKSGKSPGMDGLYGEHFKHAHDKLYALLALLYNAIIIHGFLPDKIMDTLLVPLVKDKRGCLTKSDNYRPLALTCIVSKVLELLILDRYGSTFRSTDNQFGFKQSHSADLCVLSLKYVVEYYTKLNSPVYLCFLDLSKAFDKVNHWILFDKLIDRKLPSIIVRILIYWYCNQNCFVRWGNTISSSFLVSNGVRQGSILSPVLFNVFTDELSNILTASSVGCNLNSQSVNHLLYADDSVLLAPTPQALQKLLNICEQYAADVELLYNTKKTFCMMVTPKWLKYIDVPHIYLNDKELTFVQEHKYLGIIISCKMCDDLDIKQQTRALYARGNTLISKFRKCDLNVKIKLFKTYCNSFYGSNLWINYHSNVMSKLKYAYGRIFSTLFKIHDKEDILNNMIVHQIDPIEVILRKVAFSLYSRVNLSKNTLVKTIVDSLFFCDSAIFNIWQKILF